MEFRDNPYYNPEKCGLQIFASVDTADSYEFDIFAVCLKLDDNTLWWDTDSGCSCPCPFSNSDHGHDLKPIVTKGDFFDFDRALKNHSRISPSDYSEISMDVRKHLKIRKNAKAPK